MTNAKTDHINRKSTSTSHPERAAIHSRDGQTKASTTMIEACDRLTQKLDEVAGLVREQIEAGRQTRPPATPRSSVSETAINRAGADPAIESVAPAGALEKTQPAQRAENGQQEYGTGAPSVAVPQTGPEQGAVLTQDNEGGTRMDARGDDGPATTLDASRLVDAISRSENGWREQAAEAQQVLDAIMGHLESQAASATPKVDVADIMSRLQNLEEQQQSLQSQFSNNRWSP
jgi:hypothetical protein